MKGIGALLAVASAAAASATELSSPFTDGAVLQRDREVPVWGWAKPGETVVVGFAGQRVETTAGADGKWSVKLAPMSASSESRVLTANEAKAEDVLVGEVWICSGQSNMDCPIWGANPRYRDGMGLVELRKTVHPAVRCAKVRAPKGLKPWSALPRDRADIAWERMTPAMLEAYCGRAEWETPVSAVGWYFVRELHRSLGIPIGLVDASVGGVNIGTWTPRSGYSGHPELKELADWCSVPDEEWKTEMAKGAVNGVEKQPSALFNGLVSPLIPMAMRGLLWYQGCSNAGHDPADVYCIKMHALYDGWSREFANPGLKLYFAQLAPCNDVSSIQLGQARFAAEEPNSGMAVINDVGNLRDIHPNDKRTVATRLALHALRNDYGFKAVIAEAPVFDTAVAEGETVTVHFKGVERGFYIYNDDRSLRTGFELAGADGVFRPAEVTNLVTTVHTNGKRRNGVLSGRDIVLRAEGVKSPTAVRYLFAKPWCGSVYSSDSGLPLGIFEGKVERRELADGGLVI